MNVMSRASNTGFPVYEMFKQGRPAVRLRDRIYGTTEYDVTKQIASFDQALAQNPAGILVHPMNSDPFVEPITARSIRAWPW
jgi:ribose transport system substrate-binding protein